VLIVVYIRLARQEDEELATFFGEAFLDYAARTPAFLPWGRGRSGLEVRQRLSEGRGAPGPEAAAGSGGG
jgi:hypothetical protein